jgi:hypothetical protein
MLICLTMECVACSVEESHYSGFKCYAMRRFEHMHAYQCLVAFCCCPYLGCWLSCSTTHALEGFLTAS